MNQNTTRSNFNMNERIDDLDFRTELLEQWKTCVESADRISQRRDAANGLFTTLSIGILTAATTIGGFRSIPLLIVGIGICIMWSIYISSFRRLNDAKFFVINSIENQMQRRPFADEWQKLNNKKYNRQTTIEKFFPMLFFILYCLMICFVLI